MNSVRQCNNICLLCGDKIGKDINHLRYEHKLSSKEYYDKYVKKEKDGICEVSGKESEFNQTM